MSVAPTMVVVPPTPAAHERASDGGRQLSNTPIAPVRDVDLTPGEVRTRHVERLSIPVDSGDDRFDRITSLASALFGVPMSTVTLIDGETARFPGNTGFDGVSSVPRTSAFCDLTVMAGAPVVIEDATADERYAHLPSVLGAPYLRFYAGVPLNDEDGVTIGTFCLYDTVPRRLDRTQLAMLLQLASWARRELVDSTEMERARTVQRSLLPTASVAPHGWEMASVCQPTKGVGGDFFDHAVVGGQLILTLMDVMGKGIGAALVAASVRAIVRASVSHQAQLARLANRPDRSPLTEVVRATDSLLTDDLVQTGTLVTGFAATINPSDGWMDWIDAGHGLGVIIRANGRTERLVGSDLPLGLGLGATWTAHRSQLLPGDTLLVVSDGLFDLLGGSDESFDDGIRFLALTDTDPASLIARIAEITELGSALDDVTALAVHRTAVSS